MQELLQVLKAADAAARWHVHQRRKGPAEEPMPFLNDRNIIAIGASNS